jgi:hypothetical protein
VAYSEFFSGGGVQQIQLRTEGRENGYMGAEAPYSGVALNLQMSQTRILIRLLGMYFPRNREFGLVLSKLRNFGGRGCLTPQAPLGTPLDCRVSRTFICQCNQYSGRESKWTPPEDKSRQLRLKTRAWLVVLFGLRRCPCLRHVRRIVTAGRNSPLRFLRAKIRDSQPQWQCLLTGGTRPAGGIRRSTCWNVKP